MEKLFLQMRFKTSTSLETIIKRCNLFLLINIGLMVINSIYMFQDINESIEHLIAHLISHNISLVLCLVCIVLNFKIIDVITDQCNHYDFSETEILRLKEKEIIDDVICRIIFDDINKTKLAIDKCARLICIIQFFTLAVCCLSFVSSI